MMKRDLSIFKIGSKVKAIRSSGGGFLAGNVYTISRLQHNSYDLENLRIHTDSDEHGTSNGWGSENFQLVEEPLSTKFIGSTDKPISGKMLTLPTDSEARKQIPAFSGCIKYFPAAIAGVAKISKAGNDKHNPGQELHHDRTKSLDHADCILRHLMDVADLLAALNRGEETSTEQILTEASSLAWRALAFSQALHEKYDGAPLAPGAKGEHEKT